MPSLFATKPAAKAKPKKSKGKRGYFFRAGRGWCVAVDSHNSIMLRDEAGNKLLDRKETEAVRESYARWLVRRKAEVAQVANSDLRPVEWVVESYLTQLKAECEAKGKMGTYVMRAPILFDFCTGLKGSVRLRWRTMSPADLKAARIHKGYGEQAIGTLTLEDIGAWFRAHKGWKNQNAAKRAIKRCFNWATDEKLITKNPVKGLKATASRARETYFTPAQEAALYSACLNQRIPNRPMWVALKVCIRTGMRFGIEFAKLTAAHCEVTEDAIVCQFKPGTAKGKKRRTIYISKATAAEVYGLFIEHLDKNPTGPLFRNTLGEAWTAKALSQTFIGYRARLVKQGIEFDSDSCMYATRHTYAKRTLEGYWTGKPARIEELCVLMGNTFAVCQKHYAQWDKSQSDYVRQFA